MPRNPSCELCPLNVGANVSRRYPQGKAARFPSKGCVHTRFWNRVEKTETCWLWTGARFRDRKGRPTYGSIWNGTSDQGAHTFSWVMHFGSVPEGLKVLHNCNVYHCVRPSHLYVGTHQDNMNDRRRNGGYPTGEGWRAQRAS